MVSIGGERGRTRDKPRVSGRDAGLFLFCFRSNFAARQMESTHVALVACIEGNLLSARAALSNSAAGSVDFRAGITMLEKAITDLSDIGNELIKAKRLALSQDKQINHLRLRCDVCILMLTLQFPCVASRVTLTLAWDLIHVSAKMDVWQHCGLCSIILALLTVVGNNKNKNK